MCYAGSRRKYVFGITQEQYQELWEKQQGLCPICDRPETELTRGFHVDHDHHTGEIRGLLCSFCNHRVIGRHRRGGRLKKAAEYLERETYTNWFVPEKFKKGQNKKRRKKNAP